jgi:hypothetical protein
MSTGSDFRATPQSPLRSLVAITPDDNADIPSGLVRGLYVGTSGNVSVILADDSAEVTLHNLAAGIFHPIIAKRVRATGTTAQNIRGGR